MATIRVEAVYATRDGAVTLPLELPAGTTLGDALLRIAADPSFAAIDLTQCAVGVFGEVAPVDRALTDGDRIEFYRPLVRDPKEARRRRASGDASDRS